jgi:hypothetical protein
MAWSLYLQRVRSSEVLGLIFGHVRNIEPQQRMHTCRGRMFYLHCGNRSNGLLAGALAV